jgi:excisionase family DNA binding protein
MKTKNLSIKELAAYLGVSTDTIRRAVRKGEIPARRVRTAYRFDLRKVLTCMRRNAEAKFGAPSASAPGGSAGRAQADPPPTGKTGACIAEGPQRDLNRSHERTHGYDDHPCPHKDT